MPIKLRRFDNPRRDGPTLVDTLVDAAVQEEVPDAINPQSATSCRINQGVKIRPLEVTTTPAIQPTALATTELPLSSRDADIPIVAITRQKKKNPRRPPPDRRVPAAKDACRIVDGYNNRIELTEALAFCPVSVYTKKGKPFPYHAKDGKHSNSSNDWNSKVPRALNYGDRFYGTCDFFQFTAQHPDEAMRAAYHRNYHYDRPYSTAPPRVQTEGGNWVTVHSMPQYTPQYYHHLPYVYKALLSFRNISFVRMEVLDSDLKNFITLYAGFAGATVYDIIPLEAGPGKVGLGQVRVVLDKKVDFDNLFLQRPCIVDHHGVFVLKAEHAYNPNYPKETIEKKHKNGKIEPMTYPTEFINLIKLGDRLS